jgi:hypothetical protein
MMKMRTGWCLSLLANLLWLLRHADTKLHCQELFYLRKLIKFLCYQIGVHIILFLTEMSAFSFMINIINIIFYVVNFNNKKVLLLILIIKKFY